MIRARTIPVVTCLATAIVAMLAFTAWVFAPTREQIITAAVRSSSGPWRWWPSSWWDQYEDIQRLTTATRSGRIGESEDATIRRLKEANLGRAAASTVAHLLTESDRDTRARAAQVLMEFGAEAVDAVPRLITIVETETDVNARQMAANTLGKIGPDAREAVPSLLNGLEDREESVRFWSAISLTKIAPEHAARAVPVLIDSLQDKALRTIVPDALATIGPPNAVVAVPALIDALKDERAWFRERIAHALKQIDRDAAATAGIE